MFVISVMGIPTGGGERKRGKEEDKSIPRDSLYPDSRGSRKYLLLGFFFVAIVCPILCEFPRRTTLFKKVYFLHEYYLGPLN